MTQTMASLEEAIDEFRRVLPAATATAQSIDRGEPWGSVALNAIDDGYVDFAAKLSSFFDAAEQAGGSVDGLSERLPAAGEVDAHPPTGMCPECGFVAFGLEFCGQCPVESDGKPCTGWMRSAVHDGDWTLCDPCSGAGRAGAADCEHCNGVGWLFMRPGGFGAARATALPIIGRRR